MFVCRSAAAITGGYAVAMVAGLSIMALQNLGAGVSVAVGLMVAVGIFVCGAVISYLTRSFPDQSVQEWLGVWSLAGTRNLRRTFQVFMRFTKAPFFHCYSEYLSILLLNACQLSVVGLPGTCMMLCFVVYRACQVRSNQQLFRPECEDVT
jgi:hypothetical protein